MLENDPLLKAVLDKPDDDGPRLAYADWCQRQTDEVTRARGEFIRLDIELPQLNYGNPRRGEVLDEGARMRLTSNWLAKSERHFDLFKRHGAVWASPLKGMVAEWTFHRGFVAGVTLSAKAFLEHGQRLLAAAPLNLVKLTEVRAKAAELFASPRLEKFPALSLENNQLTDHDVFALTESAHAGKLNWVDLSQNRIEFAGVESLVKSPAFRQMVYVGLQGNPCDPMESAALDGLSIQDIRQTPEGKRLEQKYGQVSWFHYATDSVADYPPNPFLLARRA